MSSIPSPLPFILDEHQHELHCSLVLAQIASALVCVAAFDSLDSQEERPDGGRKEGAETIHRIRRDMNEYIGQMDDRGFRRRYRMTKAAFWTLLDIIENHLPSTGEKRKRGAVPNGPISKAARLSMALRFFAGGDVLDIAEVHGVGDDEPMSSVWDVVDAIHKAPELNISFPETHATQTESMLGFKAKSRIDIDCCIGAIDGMLIWMNKPNTRDQKLIGFGPAKFFCGRKKKYGLSMMAVCDSRRRFIWVEVRMPGAASDFYAFDESDLKKKLDQEGFLRPGFCLFGDNAYVNSSYMCTPWRNVTSGPKDAMNFYHSQLRINIECAFGILVHRWGMLRKPMPINVGVGKISSLLLALCKLHNFCIDQSCDNLDSPSVHDIANIAMNGGLHLPRMDNNGGAYWSYDASGGLDRLNDLLDGGFHMDDHTRSQRRQYRRQTDLPCHSILNYVRMMDYQRPDISRQRLQDKED